MVDMSPSGEGASGDDSQGIVGVVALWMVWHVYLCRWSGELWASRGELIMDRRSGSGATPCRR